MYNIQAAYIVIFFSITWNQRNHPGYDINLDLFQHKPWAILKQTLRKELISTEGWALDNFYSYTASQFYTKH